MTHQHRPFKHLSDGELANKEQDLERRFEEIKRDYRIASVEDWRSLEGTIGKHGLWSLGTAIAERDNLAAERNARRKEAAARVREARIITEGNPSDY